MQTKSESFTFLLQIAKSEKKKMPKNFSAYKRKKIITKLEDMNFLYLSVRKAYIYKKILEMLINNAINIPDL
ncbi:hypothetical protein BC937DRAFT_92568 [Endogone sp. FLAS-F59071]|nr:hypothetical protein BC937DRAFT_92568 [Endogone sp. FLAS-F59071]|eukprot:RUS15336.1 hypothetical protein BC937DRAFT_92568 [Endogone sp. FLAS-F59071]